MMTKAKNINKLRKRRTSLEIEEEQSRTLYIRLPHTIKNEDEIKFLFFGNFKVKLPRQSTRYCHVIFTDIAEKMKNLKAIKKKLVNGKPIFAGPPRPMNLEKKKKPKQKKIVVPEPKDEPKIGKYLFISNIAPGVKASEIKDAFPGSITVALLKGLKGDSRQAKVKMSSTQLCLHYIENEAEWPSLHGRKVIVTLSKNFNKSKNSKLNKSKKSKSLKLYDSENEQTDVSKTTKESDEKKESEENEQESDTDSEAEEDLDENEEED